MAKKQLNLNQMLYNVDIGNMDWYDSLDEEEKKSFSPYVAMRFVSSIKGNKYLQESYIENVNEFCNRDFSTLQKHHNTSRLFWKLLCLCGSGKKMFHPWIKAPKGNKRKKGKIEEFLAEVYPNAKNDELQLLKSMLTKKEISQLAKDAGYSDKDIKLIK